MRNTECGVHMDEQRRQNLGQVTKLSGTVTQQRPLDIWERMIGVRASKFLADTRTMLTLPAQRDAGMRRDAQAHFFSKVSARLEEEGATSD